MHVMNYAHDFDAFTAWAEAVCWGRLTQDVPKKYNAAIIFKRAHGDGIIRRIEGLEGLLARYGEHVANIDLVRVGQPRRDWRNVAVGDGWIVVRHPNLEMTLEIADAFGTDLRLLAG